MSAERILRRVLCFLSFLAAIGIVYAAAQSKVEADLRAKLAASEAARTAALKDKADLAAALSRLSKNTVAVQSSQQTASQSAGIAQQNAELSAMQQAEIAAAAQAAAAIAQKQADKFNSNSMVLVYVQCLVLVGLFGGFVNSALISGRAHKWAVQAAKEQQDTLRNVEKHTNSMVEVMRASAFKEGFHAATESEPEAAAVKEHIPE